jgi:ribosomal protein L29
MARVTAAQLREKTTQELMDLAALEKKRLFEASMRGVSGEVVKAHEKQAGRRLLARIHTLLNERRTRMQLDEKIRKLTPLAENASSRVRVAVGSLKIGSPAVTPRAVSRRLRSADRKLRGRKPTDLSLADKALVGLTEVKRRREGLAFADPGQDRE